MILNESFEIHDTLNKKLFDGDKLKPEVRQAMLDSVELYQDTLPIALDVLDIQFVGSNASYNYHQASDIDLDIVINYDDLDSSSDILNALFGSKKLLFNSDYGIQIKGHPVEIYVCDVNNVSAVSNGIYSVVKDEWIKFPKKLDNVPQHDLTRLSAVWKRKIEKVIERADKDEIYEILNNLSMIRKNSIAVDGEYGKGNQLYKELRNLGLIDRLKDTKKKIISKEVSLESMIENMTIGMALRQDF